MKNNVRLIDANALIKHYSCVEAQKSSAEKIRAEIIVQALENAPTIDPKSLQPVGRWIVIDDDYEWDAEADDEAYVVLECECSICHERTKKDRPNFCDNCGARMKGENDD